MKTVCIVLEKHASVHMGGAELQADLLARELSARDGVRVVYLARDVPPAQTAARYPYEIRCIGSGKGQFRKRSVIFDAPRLTRTLRELAPAAIYQRMKQSYAGICARHARQAGIPYFFQAALDTDVSPGRRRTRSRLNLPFDLVEGVVADYGIRHATRIIVQTRHQARLVERGFGRADAVIIPNFQPLPEALPRKDGKTCVLWVANIHENKRPELYLEIAARFAHRSDIDFVMIGKPNPNWSHGRGMPEIEESPHVRYLGRQPIEEVNRWMERAHVFVNTSELEGFPNTFIQAWSRGAVVVSRRTDIDGGLEAQGVGLMRDSVDGLVEAIDRLAASEELRRTLRERGFRHVHDNHSMKNARRLADMLLAPDRGAAPQGARTTA